MTGNLTDSSTDHEQYDSPCVSDDRLDIFASGSDIEGPSAKVISEKTADEKKRLKDNSSEQNVRDGPPTIKCR